MLMRYNPFENLFLDFFDARKSYWTPLADIKEEEKQFIVDVEIPRMDDKDVKVSVSKDVLTIEGERKNRSFVRSFTLPTSVDPEKIEASLDRGILTVKVPKMSEKVPRKIDVKVNTGPPKR